jgi:UDP-GlcNAc3NAcA epimerase
MSQVFFEEMNIPAPDHNLNVGSGSHGAQTAKMIEGIELVLKDINPHGVLVYGDTNSTLAAAIAASKMHIPVFHVEAGLRSFDKRMPEEVNRIVCDHVSTLLFSPTQQGIFNLLREGFQAEAAPPYSPDHPGVFHCGDVMLDNTLYFAEQAGLKSGIRAQLGIREKQYVLATVHRDSNTDDPLRLGNICSALVRIADEISVVLPIHPRTSNILKQQASDERFRKLEEHPNIHLIPPVSFLDMIELERSAAMVITDSGGVQKEAYFLKTPCIILRPHTEWIEIVEQGNALLADADESLIMEGFKRLKNRTDLTWPDLFGDGKAAHFICQKMVEFFA